MRDALDLIEWDKLPGFDNKVDRRLERVEDMWQSLINILIRLIQEHVPKIKSGGEPKKCDFPVP
jgi:hypothetical protein